MHTLDHIAGWTDSRCWTTSSLEVDTERLWESNLYDPQWVGINAFSGIFGVLTAYGLSVVLLNAVTMALDLNDAIHCRLHSKSKGFALYIEHLQALKSGRVTPKRPHSESTVRCAVRLYRENGGWILSVFFSESIEIGIQSVSLLFYNGFNPFHSERVPLALKPEAIRLFAALIATNCALTATLWLFHFHRRHRGGLLFRTMIVLSDQLSDILYTAFPLIALVIDDYALSDDIAVFLGQLTIEDTVLLLAAAFPLFLICNKSILLMVSTRNALRERAYARWKMLNDIVTADDDAKLVAAAKLHGFHIDQQTVARHRGELRNADGSLLATAFTSNSKQSPNGDDQATSIGSKLKAFLSTICALYIVYALWLTLKVNRHLDDAQSGSLVITYWLSQRATN